MPEQYHEDAPSTEIVTLTSVRLTPCLSLPSLVVVSCAHAGGELQLKVAHRN